MDVLMKKSRQTDAILQCVLLHHDHPTADIIYHEVRRTFPNISLGTVYRNLSLLTKIGKIKKIVCDDHADRFDGILEAHSHFICNSCGCIVDVPFLLDSSCYQDADLKFDGKITDHTVLFRGYCANCIED